jgi:hypothetical protein
MRAIIITVGGPMLNISPARLSRRRIPMLSEVLIGTIPGIWARPELVITIRTRWPVRLPCGIETTKAVQYVAIRAATTNVTKANTNSQSSACRDWKNNSPYSTAS